MPPWDARTTRTPRAGGTRPGRATAPPRPRKASETSGAALCVTTYAAGQCREHLLRRNGLHGRINGVSTAVRGLDAGYPEHFKIAAAGPIARRIGGTEDRGSRFP